jgi:putative SOS response-associated peptidase YedK
MCGRYSLTTPLEAMRALFGFENSPNLEPRCNIAPTQEVAVVRCRKDGGRALGLVRWGLIPSWARDAGMGAKLVNARAETLAEKPSFRAAFARRRCLVPADGFYEWQRLAPKEKQAWRIELPGRAPFAFAGLWERWTAPNGNVTDSCTIITTDANGLVRPIHDRMPVILAPGDYAAWLDHDMAPAVVGLLLRPAPEGLLSAYRVGPYVNSVRNEGARCLEPGT